MRLCDICGWQEANDEPTLNGEWMCSSCAYEVGAVMAEMEGDDEAQLGWMEHFHQEELELDRKLRERPTTDVIPCDVV